MQQLFAILHEGKRVGTAYVEKQGLYYIFRCKCTLPKSSIYTVWATWQIGKEKLGICIPDGESFSLHTKVPVKRFPDEQLTFYVTDNPTDMDQDRFYPLSEDACFPELSKLQDAVFSIQGGTAGIILTA